MLVIVSDTAKTFAGDARAWRTCASVSARDTPHTRFIVRRDGSGIRGLPHWPPRRSRPVGAAVRPCCQARRCRWVCPEMPGLERLVGTPLMAAGRPPPQSGSTQRSVDGAPIDPEEARRLTELADIAGHEYDCSTCSSARSSRVWSSSGMSPISSRNMVPLAACSSLPVPVSPSTRTGCVLPADLICVPGWSASQLKGAVSAPIGQPARRPSPSTSTGGIRDSNAQKQRLEPAIRWRLRCRSHWVTEHQPAVGIEGGVRKGARTGLTSSMSGSVSTYSRTCASESDRAEPGALPAQGRAGVESQKSSTCSRKDLQIRRTF